uniref:Uncharacterized protein n=1 Tax=Roseihalotalea indica TaxID=2867963 RepID=A0AA49JFV1_9BACT|nr:hypothetical protein K4G66_27180 [Tunicatimonas sp. TK19036]
MKTGFITIFSLLTGFLCFGQVEYNAEEFQAGLMKTKTGAMIVYTGTNHSFTLEMFSENLKPSEQANFLTVDNTIFQSVIIPFQQKLDFDNMSAEIQKSNLLDYMNYELDYFKNELKQKIVGERHEFIEFNDKIYLFWYYDMPKSNKQIGKQIYLTTICFDQILNLNTPLERDKNDFNFNRDLLMKVGKTLKLNKKPINLSELYKELNK